MKAKQRVPQQDSDHIHEFLWGNLYTLTPGVEVSLRGKRGRFRFQYRRINGQGVEEITFVGGPLHGQRERFITVYPECITRVHSDRKTLAGIQRNRRECSNDEYKDVSLHL